MPPHALVQEASGDLNTKGRQESGHRANNRIENSHHSFRRRELAMLRFRRMKTLQQFASTHTAFNQLDEDRPQPSWLSGRRFPSNQSDASPALTSPSGRRFALD